MADLKDLARRVSKIADRVEQRVSDAAAEAALEMLKFLVYATPVDESTALSNWVIGLGTPDKAFITAHAVGDKGSTQVVSAEQAIADGIAVLKQKKPGQTVFLSNNAPYIIALDEGHSPQNEDFIAAAVALGKKYAVHVELHLDKARRPGAVFF